MITLEQAKTLIGMPALTPATGKILIKKIRQLECGKVIVYNEHGWCCDVNVLRDTRRQKFTFDEIKKVENENKKV